MMRLSLPARAFLGNALIIVLLGSVVVFSIMGMKRSRQQLSLIRKELIPIGASIEQLTLESNSYLGSLRRFRQGPGEDLLLQALKSFDPYGKLSAISSRLAVISRDGSLGTEPRDRLATLAERTGALQTGRKLELELAKIAADDKNSKLKDVLGPAPGGNGEIYLRVLENWEKAKDDKALAGLWRSAARTSLKLLLRSLQTLNRDYNVTVEWVWDLAEQRERQAIWLSVLLAVIALLTSVLLSWLNLRWLKPIKSIRELAYRIAQGEYDTLDGRTYKGELGQLEADLRRMAMKLHKREEMIRSQADELLKSERLSAIGKMSTQIAHEIRNPLNAIGLRLEMLEEGIASLPASVQPQLVENLRAQTTRLTREVERLTEVTEYYLKFARFPKPQKEQMDLGTLLEELLVFYREEAEASGIQLQWELEHPLGMQADVNLLKQAVLNLLKNSVEALASQAAREEGQPRIQVRAWREEDGVRLKVEDNGPGMDPETVARIFEPFFTTKELGTGLGLTLVQQILREHDGSITCSTQRGLGTAFLISLPVQSGKKE